MEWKPNKAKDSDAVRDGEKRANLKLLYGSSTGPGGCRSSSKTGRHTHTHTQSCGRHRNVCFPSTCLQCEHSALMENGATFQHVTSCTRSHVNPPELLGFVGNSTSSLVDKQREAPNPPPHFY